MIDLRYDWRAQRDFDLPPIIPVPAYQTSRQPTWSYTLIRQKPTYHPARPGRRWKK